MHLQPRQFFGESLNSIRVRHLTADPSGINRKYPARLKSGRASSEHLEYDVLTSMTKKKCLVANTFSAKVSGTNALAYQGLSSVTEI